MSCIVINVFMFLFNTNYKAKRAVLLSFLGNQSLLISAAERALFGRP